VQLERKEERNLHNDRKITKIYREGRKKKRNKLGAVNKNEGRKEREKERNDKYKENEKRK
jgi:hypothetical protein